MCTQQLRKHTIVFLEQMAKTYYSELRYLDNTFHLSRAQRGSHNWQQSRYSGDVQTHILSGWTWNLRVKE